MHKSRFPLPPSVDGTVDSPQTLTYINGGVLYVDQAGGSDTDLKQKDDENDK